LEVGAWNFYQLGAFAESRLGVVVADVSGKGIPASLLMAITRTNLRQIAPRHASPVRALIELNDALSADIQAGLYVTMLYAIIDVRTHEITLARAGHELPLFVRRDPAQGIAVAEFVGSEGMALGMVPTAIFAEAIREQVVPFQPGDALVLYTDGLTEAPNEEEREFSGARLADAVQALHAKTPREINDGILEAVQRFTGDTAQRDDFTLVTVKRG